MGRFMTLEIITGDVLDVAADGLLLTIDGVKPGMEGNIARQFERRWPDDWKDLQRTVRYPVPLGRTVAVPWDSDCPWRLVLFASTLHHVDVLDGRQKRRVIQSSLSEALQLCDRYRARSLATAVLQGGWRLSAEEALLAMQTAYQAARCPHVRLLVCRCRQTTDLHNT